MLYIFGRLLIQWYSTGGVCENSTVEVCSGEQWLKTQNINKSLPAPDNYPVRVFVNITYSMTCSNVTDCESDIELQVRKPSTNQILMSYTMPDNHHLLDTTASGTQQFYFDSNEKVNMFVLTLMISRSNNTCVNVSRVLVYRHECPQQSIGLTHLPAIQAPISSETVLFFPPCAENSHFSLQGRSVPQCTSEGKWSNNYEYCYCNMKYFRDDDMCISKGKSYKRSLLKACCILICK